MMTQKKMPSQNDNASVSLSQALDFLLWKTNDSPVIPLSSIEAALGSAAISAHLLLQSFIFRSHISISFQVRVQRLLVHNCRGAIFQARKIISDFFLTGKSKKKKACIFLST